MTKSQSRRRRAETLCAGKAPQEPTNPDAITAADFQVELQEQTDARGRREMVPTCTSCPAGKAPHRSFYDSDQDRIRILQFPEVCAACPLREKCPNRFAAGWVQVTINAKDVRLINRRRREQTRAFKDRYRVRSGIEATNSILKRVTGLARLRPRGRPAVFSSILLKVAGWNLLRAASVRMLLGKLAKGRQAA
jgi:Transposase DDE domain